MGDLRKVLDEGRILQSEQHIPPMTGKLPSLWPWAVLALFLILVSVGIELFWPLREHGPLPLCGKEGQKVTSCQKESSPSAPVQKSLQKT